MFGYIHPFTMEWSLYNNRVILKRISLPFTKIIWIKETRITDMMALRPGSAMMQWAFFCYNICNLVIGALASWSTSPPRSFEMCVASFNLGIYYVELFFMKSTPIIRWLEGGWYTQTIQWAFVAYGGVGSFVCSLSLLFFIWAKGRVHPLGDDETTANYCINKRIIK